MKTLLLVTILFNLIKDIFTKFTMNPTKVLEEKNALLGPGLATNYWFGYLKWICAARDGDDDDEEEGDNDVGDVGDEDEEEEEEES